MPAYWLRFFPRFIVFGLLATAVLAGCVSSLPGSRQADRLPPVSAAATGTWHPGRIVWLDLITPDAAAAMKFYGGLCGWRFKSEENYTIIFNHERPIGGILEKVPEKKEKVAAQWLATMSVPEVDAAVDWVKEQGGRVLSGPVDMARRGRGALISDPEGGRLVILKARNGDPPEKDPGIGDWLWLEDWTLNLDQAFNFYRKLGSYESSLKGKDYIVLINEGKWRAGIRRIREAAFKGRWVPAVRVENPRQMLSRVKALGGTIWLAPGESPANPDTALISDANGALLILQPWESRENGKGGKP